MSYEMPSNTIVTSLTDPLETMGRKAVVPNPQATEITVALLGAGAILDQEFQRQMIRIDEAGQRARDIISKI